MEKVYGLWRSSSGAYLLLSPAGGKNLSIEVFGSDGEPITTYKAAWNDARTKFFYTASGGDHILSKELGPYRIKVEDTLGDWSATWSRPGPQQVAQSFYKIFDKNQDSRTKVLSLGGKLFIERGLLERMQATDANGPGDKKWFDFDPFSNGQMNVAEYKVGEAKKGAEVAKVPVQVSFRVPGHLSPAVTLELKRRAGAWKITNFLYPAAHGSDAWDLRGWLTDAVDSGGTEL